MGLAEVVRELPRLLALARRVRGAALARRPDVAVLVDSPDFNLRLARRLRRAGIPVVVYVSPQLWAWRSGRVRRIRRDVRRVLCILPFEVAFYASHGVAAEYVGHPLVDELAPVMAAMPRASAGDAGPAARVAVARGRGAAADDARGGRRPRPRGQGPARPPDRGAGPRSREACSVPGRRPGAGRGRRRGPPPRPRRLRGGDGRLGHGYAGVRAARRSDGRRLPPAPALLRRLQSVSCGCRTWGWSISWRGSASWRKRYSATSTRGSCWRRRRRLFGEAGDVQRKSARRGSRGPWGARCERACGEGRSRGGKGGGMSALRRILKMLRPHSAWVVAAAVAMAGVALATVFMVFLIGPIFDTVLGAQVPIPGLTAASGAASGAARASRGRAARFRQGPQGMVRGREGIVAAVPAQRRHRDPPARVPLRAGQERLHLFRPLRDLPRRTRDGQRPARPPDGPAARPVGRLLPEAAERGPDVADHQRRRAHHRGDLRPSLRPRPGLVHGGRHGGARALAQLPARGRGPHRRSGVPLADRDLRAQAPAPFAPEPGAPRRDELGRGRGAQGLPGRAGVRHGGVRGRPLPRDDAPPLQGQPQGAQGAGAQCPGDRGDRRGGDHGAAPVRAPAHQLRDDEHRGVRLVPPRACTRCTRRSSASPRSTWPSRGRWRPGSGCSRSSTSRSRSPTGPPRARSPACARRSPSSASPSPTSRTSPSCGVSTS